MTQRSKSIAQGGCRKVGSTIETQSVPGASDWHDAKRVWKPPARRTGPRMS
jgi:hypothetical protein